MSKFLDETGLSQFWEKIKLRFLERSETAVISVLDIDNTPTPNSTNLVTSGGVKAALDNKANKNEMSVVAGTGANADKTTITLKNDTSATVLTSHQDISGKADKATTLAGYGITDAKITNGTITLGNNTITPVTAVDDGSISNGRITINKANNNGQYGLTTLTDTVENVSNKALTPAALYSFGLSVSQALNGKLDTLVSGTNIKTVNNESLLGSGNISISTELSSQYAPATTSSAPASGDTYETAVSKLHKVIVDNEEITSISLNELNNRLENYNGNVVHKASEETISGDKTFTGSVNLGSNATATTPADGDNDTSVATTAFVQNAVNALPTPMLFKGSLGTGGTYTGSSFPPAANTNKGWTVKVITDGTYQGVAAKVGDTLISDGTNWILIPSGDEPSGTVTSIQILAESPISIDVEDAITSNGVRTITHDNSGITAGTYKSVTVDAKGHVTAGTNPTTLAGYGITDAVQKITSTDNAIAKFDGTNGAIQNSGATINDDNMLSTNKVRSANTIYGISFGRTTLTPVETILKTGIKWASSTHMPVLHITGYAYGLQSPVEFKIGFYIYGGKIGSTGVTNMGSWAPEVYLYKYTNSDNIDCVAVGLKGSCYFLQLSCDLLDEMGKFAQVLTDSSAWSWEFLTTEGTIPQADDGTTCVQVPYKADILSQNWSLIKNKPTTLAGYGITDAINTSSTAQTKAGNLTAAKFITSGGISSQFVKGDGTLDSNTYLTSSDISGKADKANQQIADEPAAEQHSSTYDATVAANIKIDTNSGSQSVNVVQHDMVTGTITGTITTDKTTIPTSAAVANYVQNHSALADWDESDSDDASYIKNKPDIVTREQLNDDELVVSAALNDLNTRINDLNDEKQDTLVSGTDIKTINNQSILGSGNIDITSDLGDSLVAMFSKLDEITPVRTIEYDIASTTGQIIFSRANVTEDMLNTVTDTLIYSIEVTGNSDTNIYAQYKVYARFQPCPNRSPMTFIEHIHRNPAGTASLEGLKLLTYYYPKAVNNGYPYICYITAPAAGSRHIKIRVYLDSSNVSWKNPAVPVAVTEGLYNTTYLTKGSEMTITASGWITNGITQAATTTATVSTSLPKNFTANIFLAGEALTGGNLVYRALNDGKIYRVGTLTATINDVSTNLTLDPMFGVTRIINSRAINANIPASDLDYKRSINPSTPNNGSSFQIETGWVKGDTMYYKCTLSGSSLIPTGHITSTLSPGYAYFPIGVINTASSMDFDCIGHEFVTLNASGKVTHVNGLEIAGGSGGGGSQDLSDYVKYSNTTSSTDPNGSCSSSETVEDNAIYTSGSTHYVINPGYTISLDVLSDAYTTYIINNTSPKTILASGTGDIEWTNTTSSNIDVLVGSGTSGLNYIATIYLKGYTEEIGEIKEKVESINGVLVLPLSAGLFMISGSDYYFETSEVISLDSIEGMSDFILMWGTQLDNILSFHQQLLSTPLYVLLMIDFDSSVDTTPYVLCNSLYNGGDGFYVKFADRVVEFIKQGNTWNIYKTKGLYNKIEINNQSTYTPNTNGVIDLPLKTVNNQQIFGSGNILTTNAPLLEKTYENYTCAAANVDKGYIYFMNVVPTSDNYYEPWYVHYILEITTSVDLCLGYYEMTMGSAGTTSLYRHFNRLYSTSYIPTYYHLMAWHNSAAKYANKATYPIKLGERIYSAYGTTTVARTYNIKVIDMYNCTVTFPDNIETYDSFYSDSNYGYNSYWNAYTNGGMDNWDANTVPYLYYEHYPLYYIHDAQTPLYRYKICGFDDDNRLVPVTITNRTSPAASTLTPCKVPMTVSRGLVYYATTTNITDPTVLTANGVIYRGNEVGIEYFRYNFDTLPGNNLSVYLKGTYTISTDTFVLDDDYYVFVPTNVTSSSYSTYFTEGKYYWYIGRTGNYSTANYGGFNLDNPLYQYNGTKLVPITSIISSSGGGGDTNVIETVKVNGTALTPDANKAVNIDLSNYDKTPLIIEIGDSVTTVPAGTYASITTALSNGRKVFVKVYIDHQGEGNINYHILPLVEKYYVEDDEDSYYFSASEYSTTFNASIFNNDDFGYTEKYHAQESHHHGNIQLNGSLQFGDITITNGDKLVVTDASDDNRVARASLTFDGSTTTQALSKKGTWETFYQIPAGGIPTSDLAVDPITSVTMNGNVVLANTGGAINLGTVITSHLSIKTINNNVITGTGNVTIPTGDTNVIETIKVNNTALTPTSKAVNITVPTKLEDLEGSSDSIHVTQSAFSAKADKATTLSGYGITDAKIANGVITLGSNTITPLTSHLSIKTINNTTITGTGNVTIATPGILKSDNTTAQTTANNESLSGTVNLHKISKTGNYNDLIDKPTIPSAVTESTVSGWGFTKNAGTITSVTGSNGLTGSGSSGSVTISHAAPSTSPAKSTSAVYPITIDKYGHITAAGTAVTIPTQVTESTVSGWGFTKNVGTVTSVEVNGTTASLDAGGCVSIEAITGIEYASHPIAATNGVVDILAAILSAINSAKVTIYSGTAAPSNSLGTNGDLYLLTS